MIYSVDYTTYTSVCRGMNVVVKDNEKEKSTSIFFMLKATLGDETSFILRDKRVLTLNFEIASLAEIDKYKGVVSDVPINLHLFLKDGEDFSNFIIPQDMKVRLVLHLGDVVVDLKLRDFCIANPNVLLIGGDILFIDGIRYGSLYGIRNYSCVSNGGSDTTYWGKMYSVVDGAEFVATTARNITSNVTRTSKVVTSKRKPSFYREALKTRVAF